MACNKITAAITRAFENHGLGLEVPCRSGSETRRYLPDFVVLADDGHGPVPGVNHLGTFGRWAFAELTEIYQIESDFKAKVERAFEEMIARAGRTPAKVSP
jgi:type III restriction enzyme